MSAIPETVRRYLLDQTGTFRGISRDQIRPEQHLTTHLARSGTSYLLLITRAQDTLDLERIATLIKRPIALVTAEESRPAVFESLTTLPPLPHLFNLTGLIDPEVLSLGQLSFDAGDADHAIRTTLVDLKRLLQSRVKVANLIRYQAEEASLGSRIIDSIRRCEALPPFPAIAQQIIRLRNNPFASASELVAIIEQDPALAVQMIRYANSPLYGGMEKIVSLERAVIKMGYELVLNLALGLALGQSMAMPKGGKMGAHGYWEHSLATATLTKALIETIDYSRRPAPALGYLAGLLHNIGLLYIGHHYPQEYQKLMQAQERQPNLALHDLENALLGVDHTLVGNALFTAWGIQDDLPEVVTHHHDPLYRGKSRYPSLVAIASTLLQLHYQIGDSAALEPDPRQLDAVGLEGAKIAKALAVLERELPHLKSMAYQLAA